MTPSVPDSAEDAWLTRSRATLARARLAPQAQTVGRVEHVADGIALISGLPDVRLNELLRFEGNRLGFALTLDADAIGAVLLDDSDAIFAGSRVAGTGQVVEVPVGEGLLGRSSIRSAGLSIATKPCRPPRTCRSSGPLLRSSSAISSRSRSRPAFC